MDPKKEPKPHHGVTVPGVIAILTGITSLLIFLTGKTNLPAILHGEIPTATATSTLSVAQSPTATQKVTDTSLATPTITLSPTVTILRARAPSDSDLETIPSIWTLTNFRELPEPSSQAYTVEVTHDSEWVWDCYFCAANEEFPKFIGSLDLEFRIGGVPLGKEYLREFDKPGIKGWLCRYWSTLISNWPPDHSVFLEIHYFLRKAVSDGRTDFPAGEYSQLLVVVVKG
jgi:hypothetical protein